MNKFIYVIGGGLVVASVLTGVVFHQIIHSSAQTSISSYQKTSFGEVDWQDNGADQPRLVEVIQGHLLGTTTGVVKTDTDCIPDTTGLSHCHDIIALSNHTQITVIYTHNMNRVKCLDPNESIIVQKINPDWAKIIVNSAEI